jgi:hypothetical protein
MAFGLALWFVGRAAADAAAAARRRVVVVGKCMVAMWTGSWTGQDLLFELFLVV